LGSEAFRDWAYQQCQNNDREISQEALRFFRPGIEELTEQVAKCFKVSPDTMTTSQRGRVGDNIPRWVVMYLA